MHSVVDKVKRQQRYYTVWRHELVLTYVVNSIDTTLYEVMNFIAYKTNEE
jgi:hypothetical protein